MAKNTEFIFHLNLLCDCRHNKTSLYNNKYSETVFFPSLSVGTNYYSFMGWFSVHK